MRKHILLPFALILTAFFFISCTSKSIDNRDFVEGKNQPLQEESTRKEHTHGEQADEKRAHEENVRKDFSEKDMDSVHLSMIKFNSLGIKVDTIPTRALAGVVDVNGRLELFPQHKAIVTAILGANVTDIKVIEGEKVKKGQVLAYLSHPNLTNLQTTYIRAYNQMQFLEKEYDRQKRLYDEGIGSGKTYQQTQADYQTMKGEAKGFEAQLKQLSIDVGKVRKGNLFQYVPVVSPIDGYIEKVLVQTGQFVNPETQMLSIINNDYIHADLMVFEKDVHKVREGQKVSFTVESVQGKILSATIFSVAKNFEQSPRAVHVHAEIDQKEHFLIPGMYIKGKIYTERAPVKALPEEAIIVEEGKSYIFKAEAHREDGKLEWEFTPVEIRTGISNQGWVEINLLEPLPENAKVAWNNAYYLIAEMKKGETSHEH
ncbi:MAG: efflux RND transporter periplasmic adaptor subunit [Candidatus Obscuribacterales bacterium]|nr:efflux RND transporter periplasmic adaptor subunit [Candidatus Obscuribacterales bacterium]